MRGITSAFPPLLAAAVGALADLPEGPSPQVPSGGVGPGDYPNYTVSAASWTMETRGEDDIRMDLAGEGPLPWSVTAFAPGMYAPRLNVSDPGAASANLGIRAYDIVATGSSYEWEIDISSDWPVSAAAWNPDPARGVLMAGVRRNGQEWEGQMPLFHGLVSVALGSSSGTGYSMVDGGFRRGTVEIRIDRAGMESAGIIDTAAVWFPYAQGWLGGHVGTPGDFAEGEWHAEGLHSPELPVDASQVVVWDDDQGVPVAPATVSLEGVDARGDGMLFTQSIFSATGGTPRYTAADPRADGSGWDVVMRPDGSTDHEYMEDRGLEFSFLYVPYDSVHLIGGHIRGRDANVLNGRGQFTVRRLVAGRYELAIPGKGPSDGLLLLGCAGRMAGNPALVSRSFLSYEAVAGDRFWIESRYYQGGDQAPLEDSNFYFAWVDFVQPLAPPGFSQIVEPPSFVHHPASLEIEAGTDIEFQAEASGDPPLVFQWLKDGEEIEGATGTSLLIPAAGLEDAGSYRVRATNGGGEALSNPAVLSVLALPEITRSPGDLQAFTGDSVRWEAAATGTPPLQYQWQKDGVDIEGAVSTVLELSNLAPEDAGQYRIRVANALGEAYSATGRLTIVAVERAPEIVAQPQDATVPEGGEAVFSVEATGYPALSYQWLFGDEPIANATGSSLSLSQVSLDAAGEYQVHVINSAGTARSRVAVLAVVPRATAPVIVEQPSGATVSPGQSVVFRVVASGTAPLSYQWRFNGEDIANATGSSLTIAQATSGAAGEYRVLVSNSQGSALSRPAILAVGGSASPPRIQTHPRDQSAVQGQTVVFTVAATGSAPLSYQWQFNGADLPQANSPTLSLTSVTLAQAGSYRAVVSNPYGSANSDAAALVVRIPLLPPRIETHPAGRTVREGQSVSFEVEASGSAPLSYQWQRDGADIPGATSPIYQIPSAEASHAGSYRAVVSNAQGSAASNAAVLVVQPPLVPPLVAEHPRSLSVEEGEEAVFEVAATGSAPLVYQWQFNGANIPGATSESYRIGQASLSHAGSYRVVVSNTRGSAISDPAQLTVAERPPDGSVPVITVQPADRAALIGSNIAFSVEATGPPPLSYQWQKGELNIPGARSSTFEIANVQAIDAGSYRVVVTGGAGFSVASEPAELSIATAPVILEQPRSQSRPEGGVAVFQVAAEGIPPIGYQWQFNGANIPGAAARQPQFRIEGVGPGDQGAYRVVVTDAQGTTVSEEALLTVSEEASAPSFTGLSLEGAVLTLEWEGGPDVVLQIKAELGDPAWQDVPGSQGQSSIQQLALGFSAWYRLVRR